MIGSFKLASALAAASLVGVPCFALADSGSGDTATVRSHALSREDVDAWLDGLLPYAMQSGQIAGGVVIIVKDGQVLTEKGYGYADLARKIPMDPETTVIRPGSISKLFTWTAVMQLVEQGTLDLDADLNRYLDFSIAPFQGKPMTLRNIMTHTSGFEESFKDLDTETPPAPLASYVRSHLPRRIYLPGKVPAYSNYATALAGYIVERMSREPFDAYIERHILTPLGMNHSTFRQPLPENLRPWMSQGYTLDSQPPRSYEFFGPTPAGAMATTAADMARFMVAHLQDGEYAGGRILSAETAATMHASQPKIYPALNGMALGFYETRRNGHRIIAHNGGTQYFHSDLHLLLDDRVGLFISLNSAGSDEAATRIHNALFQGFTDRYFPARTSVNAVAVSSAIAVQHSQLMVGSWENSRRSASNFMTFIGFLDPMTITANADGTISLPVPTRGPMSFREIGPFLWQDVAGADRIQALVSDGRPVMLGFGIAPPAAFLPIPAWRSPAWLLPASLVALGVLLLTGLSWPIGAMTRRFYKLAPLLAGRPLLVYRMVRAACLANVAVMLTFLATLVYLSGAATRFSSAADGWLLCLQMGVLIIVPGALAVAVWNAFCCLVVALWLAPEAGGERRTRQL